MTGREGGREGGRKRCRGGGAYAHTLALVFLILCFVLVSSFSLRVLSWPHNHSHTLLYPSLLPPSLPPSLNRRT